MKSSQSVHVYLVDALLPKSKVLGEVRQPLHLRIAEHVPLQSLVRKAALKTMVGDDVVVLDISIEIDLARTLGVIRHVNRTLSNAGEAFISLLRDTTDHQR